MYSCRLCPGNSAQAGKRQIHNPVSPSVLRDIPEPALLGPFPAPEGTLLPLTSSSFEVNECSSC